MFATDFGVAPNDIETNPTPPRETTQRALLQATIDCLIEYGYAGTTTRIVADRAQVSRGAQTHHYATKHDLVVAAIEFLFDDQAQHFSEAFEKVPSDERTLGRALEELWAIVSGPQYAAVLEVVVAGRTDDQLRVVVHGVALGLQQTIADLLIRFFPEVADEASASLIIDLALALVQGAAVSQMGGFGAPQQVIAITKGLSAFLTPDVLRLLVPPPESDQHP